MEQGFYIPSPHSHCPSVEYSLLPVDIEIYSTGIKQPELKTCFHLVLIYTHPLICFYATVLSCMEKFTFNPSSQYPKYVFPRL
jgi:hypothetical protein